MSMKDFIKLNLFKMLFFIVGFALLQVPYWLGVKNRDIILPKFRYVPTVPMLKQVAIKNTILQLTLEITFESATLIPGFALLQVPYWHFIGLL